MALTGDCTYADVSATQAVNTHNLRCEYQANPLGIGARRPRLSWQMASPHRGAAQSAYQVRVALSPDALVAEGYDSERSAGPGLLWDSGRVASDQAIHVPYAGPALRSGQRCYWQVRIWDERGTPSRWSKTAWWEMGLLEPGDWTASWIEPGLEEDISQPGPCPVLRGEFQACGRVKSARAYITSLGLYEAEINGHRVGDDLFTPGWTSYAKRLQYQTYDVTELLAQGMNAVVVTLGDGWYRGWISHERNRYGDRLALLLQIRVEYEDGRSELFGTGDGWKATNAGPIRASDIYMGETYDARLEQPAWSMPGYDDSGWAPAKPVTPFVGRLEAPVGPPVRRMEELRPVAILHASTGSGRAAAGTTIFDFGQNLVGHVRLRVSGPAGVTIKLRHAEVLDRQGNLYVENLRLARQEVCYTLKGKGEEVYEPHFTFHGFRYVAAENWPGEPTLDSLMAVVVHSDLRPTGSFTCSNPLLNRLQRNIVWGQKGNSLDVPTDCPQRDERLGWTGDAQVFARTAAFNMNVAGFFTKWLADLAADQGPDGNVPHVVPDVLSHPGSIRGGSAGWADAATVVPWTIYLHYGDRDILERQYPSMVAWVEYMREQAGETCLWSTGAHFGDWLSVTEPGPTAPAGTDTDLIATAFYAYSTSIVQQTAEIVGRAKEASQYAALLARIRAAFVAEFVTKRGRLASNTQTAYTLALMFELLAEDLRPEAARRLAQDVRQRGNHVSTGFLGTPYLCHALSRCGYLDVAYDLLNQDTCPSWLYPVTMGATTVWERWGGIRPDGQFEDPEMNSFNHCALGAVGDWLYRVVAGIEADPAAPGYKHLLVQPQPGGELTHVCACLETMYGRVRSEWALEAGQFRLAVAVPANTRATVRLPGARLADIREGELPLDRAEGVAACQQEEDAVTVEVSAGSYRFAYPVGTR